MILSSQHRAVAVQNTTGSSLLTTGHRDSNSSHHEQPKSALTASKSKTLGRAYSASMPTVELSQGWIWLQTLKPQDKTELLNSHNLLVRWTESSRGPTSAEPRAGGRAAKPALATELTPAQQTALPLF